MRAVHPHPPHLPSHLRMERKPMLRILPQVKSRKITLPSVRNLNSTTIITVIETVVLEVAASALVAEAAKVALEQPVTMVKPVLTNFNESHLQAWVLALGLKSERNAIG